MCNILINLNRKFGHIKIQTWCFSIGNVLMLLNGTWRQHKTLTSSLEHWTLNVIARSHTVTWITAFVFIYQIWFRTSTLINVSLERENRSVFKWFTDDAILGKVLCYNILFCKQSEVVSRPPSIFSCEAAQEFHLKLRPSVHPHRLIS